MKGVEEGKWKDNDYRPTIYMFPNGQFCGDVDYNPFNLFHDLSRKTDANPWIGKRTSDLTVVIPGRNEMFHALTIKSVLDNIRGDTYVIAVCDGAWPDPPIPDHPRLTVIHHSEVKGQRVSTNEGFQLARTKFVMKLDAHCAVDEGFDVKLMDECDGDWIVTPRLYNLHAFDWVCESCGERRYQGPSGLCKKCGGNTVRDIIWKPRDRTKQDFYRFDRKLHFQYWWEYHKRPQAQGDIAETMSCLGACFFGHRKRFEDIEWLDDGHGKWGQVGTEVACKSFLSGGKLVVNKRTWFSHMFRTQGGDFSFPYEISGNEQARARKYSQDLWLNNKWKKQVRPLEWRVEHFKPVPDWH